MNTLNVISRPAKITVKNYLFSEKEELYVCDEPSTYGNYVEPKVGSWIWHVDEDKLYWSHDLCRMMGVSDNPDSGFEQWIKLLAPEDLIIFSSAMENILKDFKPRNFEFRIKVNQRIKTILCNIDPIIDPNSEKVLDMIGICRDITNENLSSTKEIKKQLRKQEDINRKLLMIIAHDLRTPFNSILGLSEILLQKDKKLEETKIDYYLRTILTSARNAYSMIVGLADWAKTQREGWCIMPVRLNLHKLVLEIFEELRTTAELKEIELINRITIEYYCNTDKETLRIILRNLIANALKFSFRNSEIIVMVKPYGDYYQLSVTDFGIGMEPEDARAIFNSGITNSPGTGTAKEKGLGVGLSICKELIDRLGGKIWVESEIGNGSTFYFQIRTVL